MLRGSMANGSPNDGIMCELIGDNWKELTGCDLGVRRVGELLVDSYTGKYSQILLRLSLEINFFLL